ncbi:Permease of the drug/metabolite transporter (DMT) family [Desulfamplus magnetovallimortis]|uniref:Permease of the drug/metabolite transporter (DMT) family n=1 Tax=Desulfamplus magnetovallimortis TaxID=1246637 RepID=A0A1W1HD95_9BACT|nr:DMT family transporter [Desulfamplus magnetovallimortis]SLM30467.1 Permease of the drug/metabolite transporter (DMT) family [Desulfamplus magnetovallimortis]
MELVKKHIGNSCDTVSSNNELPVQAALYTAFLCTLFGANAVAIKITLSGMGIFTNAGIRFAIAATTLFIWARLTGQPLLLNRDQAVKMFILSMIFTVQLSCFYNGLSRTTASHGTLIANLLPFVVLILAHFFIPGDRITLKKISGILFGFTGVAFLFIDGQAIAGDLLTGDIIICCAVFLWGCNAVYVKRVLAGISAVQITLYPMMFGAPLFLIAGFLWDGEMIRFMNPSIVKALIYQSFITAAYGFVAWNGLLHRFGATALHSFIFIMPVSGVIFSVMLLGEPLTMNIIISIILIIAGTFVVNRPASS